MQSKLLAARKHQILGNFDSKCSSSTKEYTGRSLLGNCLHAHGSNISTPPILDGLIIDIDFLLALLRTVDLVIIGHIYIFKLRLAFGNRL